MLGCMFMLPTTLSAHVMANVTIIISPPFRTNKDVGRLFLSHMRWWRSSICPRSSWRYGWIVPLRLQEIMQVSYFPRLGNCAHVTRCCESRQGMQKRSYRKKKRIGIGINAYLSRSCLRRRPGLEPSINRTTTVVILGRYHKIL